MSERFLAATLHRDADQSQMVTKIFYTTRDLQGGAFRRRRHRMSTLLYDRKLCVLARHPEAASRPCLTREDSALPGVLSAARMKTPWWCPHVRGEVQRQLLDAGACPWSIRSGAELVVLGGDFHLDDRAGSHPLPSETCGALCSVSTSFGCRTSSGTCPLSICATSLKIRDLATSTVRAFQSHCSRFNMMP